MSPDIDAVSTYLQSLQARITGALESVEPSSLDGVRDAVRELSGFEARFSHFPIVGLCARCARQRERRAAATDRG